jgi:long-chain acyl-CoA synthetase
VAEVGEGLVELGLLPGDRVAIISNNRYHWAVADFSAITRGAVSVPIYPTLPPNQVAAILQDSGAKWVFAEDAEQVQKIFDAGRVVQDITAIVTMDEVAINSRQVMTVAQLREQGAGPFKARDVAPQDVVAPADPEELATIIYTSGTTGEPKGVMLTHGNLVSNVAGALEQFPISSDDLYLSFLPLSHVFERMAGLYTMYMAGCGIAYAEAIETVAADAVEVRPTIMMGVPRFFEKFYGRVNEAIESAPPVRQKLFNWARRVGLEVIDLEFAGEPVPKWKQLEYRTASTLVFKKLKGRIGGRVRFFVSGSAPLRSDLIRFFSAVGIPIYEGYGLTEASPVITCNCPKAMRLGSVGQPFPNVRVRIAEDGEILARGPNTTSGYFRKPEATKELYTDDGWLKTGDIGRVDDDGYLYITDRKKNVIKTASGKMVAPQPIEIRLVHSPVVADAIVVGDKRKFVSAILLPDFVALESRARTEGISASSRESLVEQPAVQAMFQHAIDEANQGLARHETVKRFIIIPDELTIADGSLTPSMKMKRPVVIERYESRIDALYDDD